jgi:hypothetical protein
MSEPILRSERHEMPGVGPVLVRMLKLSERLALNRPLEGADAAAAGSADSRDIFAARLLATSVRTLEGEPLYSMEQWDIFGATQTEAFYGVLEVAMRLSGMDGDHSKND